MVVLYDFEGVSANELSVKEGDVVYLVKAGAPGAEDWVLVAMEGKQGFVPTAYVQRC